MRPPQQKCSFFFGGGYSEANTLYVRWWLSIMKNHEISSTHNQTTQCVMKLVQKLAKNCCVCKELMISSKHVQQSTPKQLQIKPCLFVSRRRHVTIIPKRVNASQIDFLLRLARIRKKLRIGIVGTVRTYCVSTYAYDITSSLVQTKLSSIFAIVSSQLQTTSRLREPHLRS